MIEIKEVKEKFQFYRNEIKITTPSGNILEVTNKKHAYEILEELNKPKRKNNSNSILNLTLFSCNLDEKDKILIIKEILETLRCDSILYRCFDDKKLIDLMNKNLNIYINKFKRKFNSKVVFLNTILATCDEKRHN